VQCEVRVLVVWVIDGGPLSIYIQSNYMYFTGTVVHRYAEKNDSVVIDRKLWN